ncbi:MAG: MotA/TolQ/ExbB proton channel family protein [Candidatus Omnitrophica bacterium]|nr:MotA/TolQ/ExbB proton channel family protein [Candidatus Omnitrophota bacterium]
MPKNSAVRFAVMINVFLIAGLFSADLFAAQAAGPDKAMTLWELVKAGGSCMIFLGALSVLGTASVIYHFRIVTPERLVPREFSENLLFLLEKKEHAKALSVCRQQQDNLVAAIALKGLARLDRGKSVVEEAIQYEGKARIEKLWQNLSYLGDVAAVAPMLGLLGTILGMIEAFNYQAFRAGIIQPVSLAQGLAKAMITTAFGLIIAVPALVFYSYFRGRIGTITSSAERVSAEILHAIQK